MKRNKATKQERKRRKSFFIRVLSETKIQYKLSATNV